MKINKLIHVVILGLISILAFSCATRSMIKGETSPVVDANGNKLPNSISEITNVEIGGIDQYLIIRGADTSKPVILFVHGGPGSPETALMRALNPTIENDFVMVYWEQRGAGKSYSNNIPPETMNLEQFISDTQEVSEYLIKRFGKEKIFIMGHSWGSFLGILTAYQHPELYHAYFGVGQSCMQYESEKVSFDWVKEQARLQNDKKGMRRLSKSTFPSINADSDEFIKFIMQERKFVIKYGGAIHGETSMRSLLKFILKADEYSFKDKRNYMRGNKFSITHLFTTQIQTDLSQEIDSMQVPVYIFQGKYDYQCPTQTAKEFYDQLKAPTKDFFIFENSAHNLNIEEPKKFNAIVLEKVQEHFNN